MSNLKRGYLNREEENFYMVVNSVIEMMEGARTLDNKITEEIWIEWEKRGMITPSMKKHIKLAKTYLTKFRDELYENVDIKTKTKLDKKSDKFDFKIVDDYSLQKLLRDIKDRLNYAILSRNNFLEILEDVSGVACVGCKKDYKECQLCRALEDMSVAYVGEEPNCPFAVDLSELTTEQKERLEKLKCRLRSNNIAYKG